MTHLTLLLLLWLTLPILLWSAKLCVGRRLSIVIVCILCVLAMIAGNFILVDYVHRLDAHLLAEVDKYAPGTPQAQQAAEEWASDTGRSLALAFSAPLTAMWYLFLFVLLFGGQWIVGQLLRAKSTSAPTQLHREATEQQNDAQRS